MKHADVKCSFQWTLMAAFDVLLWKFSIKEKNWDSMRPQEGAPIHCHLLSGLPETVKSTVFSFTKCESFSALISWEYFCVSTIPSSSYSGVPSVLSRTFWCLLSDPWDSAHYVLSSTLYLLQLRKIATFSALKVTHSLFYNFAHIVKSILNSSYIFLQL